MAQRHHSGHSARQQASFRMLDHHCHCRDQGIGRLRRKVAELFVAVRDSKDPVGPALTFAPADWRAFITSVKRGELNLV
jgi:hypothetical protein